MRIGITATRDGLAERQKFWVSKWIQLNNVSYLEHGDCIGGDEEIHGIALKAGIKIGIRPCNIPRLRAYCEGADVYFKPTDPLVRNKIIVDQCSHLLVLPNDKEEVQRSGTWSTKRYADRIKKGYTIVYPDGDFSIKSWQNDN